MEPTKTIEELQNFNFEIKKIFDDAQDFLPILGTDYIELYVGNAKQSAHYYKTAFGFQFLRLLNNIFQESRDGLILAS